MTDPSNDDLRRAEAQAVEWVILLREEPDDPDVRARFDEWLAASPHNARAWAAMAHAYDRAGDARPAYVGPVRAAEDRPVLPVGPVPYIPRRRARATQMAGPRLSRPRPRVLAAAVAVACVAFLLFPAIMLRVEADHLTGSAELRDITLTDGSHARLAPNSAIAITYADNRRHIRLLKGEAWFDVRHDARRPFYVDAGGVTTTVLGTAFDVKRDAAGVTTQVARGRVRVDYAGAAPPVSTQLRPGEGVRVSFDGHSAPASLPADQIGAWRNRQIIVQDRPATEVVEALRPWFSGIIIVRGDSFARQNVTGFYNAADPVEALRGLTRAYGGAVTTVTPWIIILSEG